MHDYQPQQRWEPYVRDDHARTLLWVILVILFIDTAMIGYMFYYVHQLIATLHAVGDAFNGS